MWAGYYDVKVLNVCVSQVRLLLVVCGKPSTMVGNMYHRMFRCFSCNKSIPKGCFHPFQLADNKFESRSAAASIRSCWSPVSRKRPYYKYWPVRFSGMAIREFRANDDSVVKILTSAAQEIPRGLEHRSTWHHRPTGRHFTGWAEIFALKIAICPEITICPKNRQFALELTFYFNPNGAWKHVKLFYTVKFVYNGFLSNVNSPITLYFVWSRWYLLYAFQFACNVNSAITFFMQSPRGAIIGEFCSYLAC